MNSVCRHARCCRWTGIIFLFFVLSATPAVGQGVARGLDIQPGARQNGLGAAGVALFGDPSDALWWNPAALGFADRTSVQYTHATLLPDLADLPYHHVAVAAPLGSFGGFGASFTRLDYGDAAEASPSIALGARVHPMVSVGANLKWVEIWFPGGFLGAVHAETFTADLGALMRVDREPWRFGFGVMYQNFDGTMDFEGVLTPESAPLSRNWKLGASATVPARLSEEVRVGLTAVLDYNQSDVTAKFRTWHAGFEGNLVFDDILRVALRGGYYHDGLGQIQDVTYGVGLRAAIFAFDAGWIPQSRDSGLPRVLKVTAGLHVAFAPDGPRWSMD